MYRYTIFNRYIQGSNQSPQACHAMDVLYERRDNGVLSEAAVALLKNWRENSKVEIMLQGGYHADLENLYDELLKLPDVPSAKFNESMEALNGACTVVTFVASERIVQAGKYIRNNGLNPANAAEKLRLANFNDIGVDSELSDGEIFVATQVAFLSLAR